ncbi:MAG: hypothetical protein WBD40_10510, partial [Tepidisphaeraceae bacterium]
SSRPPRAASFRTRCSSRTAARCPAEPYRQATSPAKKYCGAVLRHAALASFLTIARGADEALDHG